MTSPPGLVLGLRARLRDAWIVLQALVKKELRQATRDPKMIAMLVVAPVIQITVFGYAANFEFDHAMTTFVDEDRSPESRSFRDHLAADGTFVVTDAVEVAVAEARLRRGESQVAIVLPRGFGRRLAAGNSASVQVLVDGSDVSRARSASTALESFVVTWGTRHATRGAPPVRLEPRLFYNPGLKSRIFMVPGTAGALLLVVTTLVTAMGLARERETGTLEQLLVTPISPLLLMAGKTIPYALFGLADTVLLLIVGTLVFDVPIRGPLGVVFLGALLYLVTSLAIGLLVSTLARTQQQAIMAGFFYMLPAILLSGFMTPIDAMPAWLRPISLVDPVRWFIEIMRTVLLRGGGLADVAVPLGALALLGGATLATATVKFRRSLG